MRLETIVHGLPVSQKTSQKLLEGTSEHIWVVLGGLSVCRLRVWIFKSVDAKPADKEGPTQPYLLHRIIVGTKGG